MSHWETLDDNRQKHVRGRWGEDAYVPLDNRRYVGYPKPYRPREP